MPDSYTALLSGSYWSGIEVVGAPTIVTFSFPTTTPAYVADIDDPELTPAALASYHGFSAAEQALARAAMQEWADACGLIFIEVPAGQGDINFGKMDLDGTGYSDDGGFAYRPFGDWQSASYPYFTSDLDAAGDVFMNANIAVDYATLLHEIGHAIGLKHPTEVWTQHAADPDVVHDVWATDDPALTIMSELPGGTGHLTAFDIEAVQSIYGTDAEDGTQVASWSWSARRKTLTQTGYETADAVRGSSVKDVIKGQGGDDRLFGLNGDDTLEGGAGNDSLDGGPGADRMVGGVGDDAYFVDNRHDKVVESESGSGGYDRVIAMAGHTLAAGVEQLEMWSDTGLTGTGNTLGNVIFGSLGGDVISGLAGEDYIVGGLGADKLSGGDQNDLLYGEDGTDELTGGLGADRMTGGAQADRFVFKALAETGFGFAADVIADFSHRQKDKLDLKAIDPSAVAGDQAFSFVGEAAFVANGQAQVRWTPSGGSALVLLDANGDGSADASIVLGGVGTLQASDFVL